MSAWMSFRLKLHKYNSYLLYGMCGIIFTTQMTMVYLHMKGEDVRIKPEDLFAKDEFTSKFEAFFKSLSTVKRMDPFKEDEDQEMNKKK